MSVVKVDRTSLVGFFYDKVERKTVYKRAACKFIKIYPYVASSFLNISLNHLFLDN